MFNFEETAAHHLGELANWLSRCSVRTECAGSVEPIGQADGHVMTCSAVKLDAMKRTPRSHFNAIFLKLVIFELNVYTSSPRNIESLAASTGRDIASWNSALYISISKYPIFFFSNLTGFTGRPKSNLIRIERRCWSKSLKYSWPISRLL